MLRISRSTAARLVADGLEPVNGSGYPLDQARQLLSIRALRSRTAASDLDALELRRQKLSLDVERARAELAITKSEWVEKRVVQAEWERCLLRVKNRFLGLGRELAPLLHGRGPIETKTIIDGRVFEILRLLAHETYCPPEHVDRIISPNNKEAL
jgi:hypothetical protein